ncbi:hypothetical protein [Yinghuangia sp. YIM S09857]|uniref:hypothetical protein n=1 Tax=Yinghuangia sp. YIM S09857 TaxID=3436929 RepID=UPI003F532A64
MSSSAPDPVGLIIGLADPDTARGVAARLAARAEGDEPDKCPNCGSPNCGGRRRSGRGHRTRPAAEIVAEAWAGLSASEESEPARPRVLRRVGPPLPGPRTGPTTPEELALRPDLGPDELASLLALDDPEVDARLFVGPVLHEDERRRMLDGLRFDGGIGTVGAPLLDLLWSADRARLRRWLPSAVRSGDPGVAAAVVGRVVLETESGRLRPIVAVWGRHGREAARTVLESASYPPEHVTAIERALDAPDGLNTLRARLAELAQPRTMIASLRTLPRDRQTRLVAQIAAEGGVFPSAEVVRAHEDDPLPEALHSALAELPGSSRELVVSRLHVGLPEDGGSARWLDAALEQGVLSPDDLLRHARPAARVLVLLADPAARDRRERWASSAPRVDTGAFFRAVLGTHVDTWVVAALLAGDFPGSVTELLETAVATHAARA